jgi:nucleotide-binding universal stress UspA family protein
MTRFLLATNSVHATAAGCDYIDDRLEAEDTVIALTVPETGETEGARDAADALNVATVRLPGAVETDRREGDPATVISEAAGDHGVDEIILVAPESDTVGSTTRAVLESADRPVVIVTPV